ncbi:MAG: glycoside hydrolase [Gammaproteobacteria bacterium]|nr:MAG: glycoside hydrolase [Gammaproteobacteria bacterium]
MDPSRRRALYTLAACSAAPWLPACGLAPARPTPAAADPWAEAEALRGRIRRPEFARRDFPVTRYGGVGDGVSDETAAFARAVAACAAAGGGRVIVPAGRWSTGPIHLKSGVCLHVDAGAEVRFVPDPKRHLPPVFTRWEGVELMGYSPLIYAFECEDVGLTGEGILDGGADADHWWPWKGGDWARPGVPQQHAGRRALFEAAERGVPVAERVFAEGAYLRPPFVQTYRCRRVLIEGVTLRAAPFWLIHPVLCEDVVVRGVTCASLGPNSDGCDPESCRRVWIEGCIFDTGDDCIAIKSGRNADGRRLAVPSEDILIENCRMRAGHGGVVIGSEISGGMRNLYVQDVAMSSPDLERGLRIKTNARRGGRIENLNYRRIRVGEVGDLFVINFYYEEGADGDHLPQVGGIRIEDLHCAQARRIFHLRGFPDAPIGEIRLRGLRIDRADILGTVEYAPSLRLEDVWIGGWRRF